MDSASVIEGFLAQYPQTIAALSAFGTLAAVIVALYIARRQTRGRLRITADLRSYFSPQAQMGAAVLNPAAAPKVVSVVISNIGSVPVAIPYWSSFTWSVLGSKLIAMQNPEEPDFRREPIILAPGRSAAIVLSKDVAGLADMLHKLVASSKYGRIAAYFPRLRISNDIGEHYSAKLGEPLRRLARSM